MGEKGGWTRIHPPFIRIFGQPIVSDCCNKGLFKGIFDVRNVQLHCNTTEEC